MAVRWSSTAFIPAIHRPQLLPRISTIGFRVTAIAPQFFAVLFLLIVTRANAQTNAFSRLLEAAGQVEFQFGGQTNWQSATNGLRLQPGDKVRTRGASRAAVQLSDRSVIRLSELTTLEILPPRDGGKKRFNLPSGSLYFFNREKPADVEFDTPMAAGAIRGTEFLLESTLAVSGQPVLHLALVDGLVSLHHAGGETSVKAGDDLRWTSGEPPRITALVNANAIIQWALYYPAAVVPDDLNLEEVESAELRPVLTAYRAGNLVGALGAWPKSFAAASAGAKVLRAQLELAVGRVTEAEHLLRDVPDTFPAKRALTELISVVRSGVNSAAASHRPMAPASASEWLAHSYTLQAATALPAALEAARMAVDRAPESGFGLTRLAELQFALGQRQEALESLRRAYIAAPQLASAHALQGFVLLEQGLPVAALAHFDRARDMDPALGSAWLGRGLCLMRQGDLIEGRAAFQAAAALEPQRSLFRSYLGKAASALGDAAAADKELRLARTLDPNDPTAWLYSALHFWQENRLNEAVRDLEESVTRNDNRAAFRSQLLLDQDRAVRSANLAALYDDAGLEDVSRHTAARAVNESYADFSGHLFLSDSLQTLNGGNSFDLRWETARQSELLVANLLAPVGAGNLSQQLSQRDRLRFFDAAPFGGSSLTEYSGNGDWRESLTLFGTQGGLGYALDVSYTTLNGQQSNGGSERWSYGLTLKQRLGAADEAYLHLGGFNAEAGDVANHQDPNQAQAGYRVTENQFPSLYAGWHHAWTPGSHTLFLYAHLADDFDQRDPNADTIFLRQSGGVITAVQSPPFGPALDSHLTSQFRLDSVELQQIWETHRQSLIVGGRWQGGDVASRSRLDRAFQEFPSAVDESFGRGNLYGYYSLQVVDSLRLIGGVTYDHVEFPANADVAPLTAGDVSTDLVAPKLGLIFSPWDRGSFRASYTKSLGGLYFDNSVRLEPTQVAGFNQAFRSLVPESVAGLVPGSEFETIGLGFDQSFASGTFLGIEVEQLRSDGQRTVGVLTNSTFLPIPDATGSTSQALNFQEQNLTVYAYQLLGEDYSIGARYRISDAELQQSFPAIPDAATGLGQIESQQTATLQQLALTANFHHRCGAFAQWESIWRHQDNTAYPDDNLWQHNLMIGYRLPRRQAEIRVGILNLFDTDYQLNPLNLAGVLPRDRTFFASLRFNF